MSSQVISYRLSTDEVLTLRQKALPGESDNQTAQRLMRESLGLSTSSTAMSTPSLDERIESVVEDKLSSFTGSFNDLLSRLQERLQRVEAHLEEVTTPPTLEASQPGVDYVDSSVDRVQGTSETVESEPIDSVDDTVDSVSNRSLTQAELAKRLKVHTATLTKNRVKPNFAEWSRSRDPEKLDWEYRPEIERYTVSSTTVDKADNLAGWKAKVDAVVGVL